MLLCSFVFLDGVSFGGLSFLGSSLFCSVFSRFSFLSCDQLLLFIYFPLFLWVFFAPSVSDWLFSFLLLRDALFAIKHVLFTIQAPTNFKPVRTAKNSLEVFLICGHF